MLDHLTPRNVLLQPLIDESSRLDARCLADYLHEWLVGAVITQADGRALTAAGVGRRAVPGADPGDLWARYLLAGLQPDSFAPLDTGP